MNDKKAITLALASVLFWSTVATAFKIGLVEFEPARLIFIATITSLLLFLALIASARKLRLLVEIKPRQYLHHAIMGFLNPFAYYLILFKAYSLLPAQVAQPINMTWPIILILMSVPLLHHKIGWKSYLALFISFIGVILISSQGKISSLRNVDSEGILLCVGSAFVWSTYWIFNVKNKTDKLRLGLRSGLGLRENKSGPR